MKNSLSFLHEELTIVLIIAILAVIAAILFWLSAARRGRISRHERAQKEELESLNRQLQEKQYALEEQNTIIEELNSQLEDENESYLRQQDTLQAIIDSLGAGIMMVDPAGRIVFINKAWKDFFNYLYPEKPDYPYGDYYFNSGSYNDSVKFLQDMTAGMDNGHKIALALTGLIVDGESCYTADIEQTSPVKRFINLYSNPCVSHMNHNFGRIFVVRDISHQKEVDRLKLELISTVSHELRTPMSSILGFSELLLTRELSGERNREYLQIINAEARRLTDLINDFLDIQRMESGKQVFNKQPNSLAQTVEEALALFGGCSSMHTILYSKNTEDLPLICFDRDKILQVLSNLLSNAIKYSPGGGEISVNLTAEDNNARISVTDHGLGIPDEVRDKLFTKFFRVDNDDRRKIGGSGLGLAICREIIRAHGGEIGVESVYGFGSTFFFSLPFTKCNADNPADNKAGDKAASENRNNLLIVEDDDSMVKLIKETLKDEGLEIYAVGSGEEALRLAAVNSYKLIILDIALSGQLNGWDVLIELKGNHATASIPIIISSVHENKIPALENNIADYLVKPFEAGQLIRMVRKALNGNLESKMAVNNDEGLTEFILKMLEGKRIHIKQVEHSGNILIITLEGGVSVDNEQ